jgi:hypothetical protein
MLPEGLITPESIGIDFVPTPAQAVAELVVGSELVVGLGPSRSCHLLNATAALVWRRFDGKRDLAAIVADLADVSGEQAQVIAADVVELTRQLGGLGLLDGVAPHPAKTPGLPSPGDEIPSFGLPDLTGRLRSWDSFRGAAVLLVNWSPYCGYCQHIAGKLSECQDSLRSQGADLVFVTSGDVEANRSLFEQSGLQGVIVLRKQEADSRDPFAGLGTPAAWFFDADGHLAAPLAYGASDLLDLAVRLGEESPPEECSAQVRYLRGSGGVCAPGGASSPGGRTGVTRVGTAVYRFGDFHVGVRFNRAETETTLDRLFPQSRIHDPKTPDNYSLALHQSSVDNKIRDLNLLFRSDLQVVRTRSAGRVLRALLGYCSMEVHQPDPGLLQADGLAVVRNDRSYILPPFLYRTYDLVAGRLSRFGLQVVDRPWVCIDPATTQIVIEDPRLPYDRDMLAELDQDIPTSPELPAVGTGRYLLEGWVFATEQPGAHLSTAASAALAAGLIRSVPSLQTVLDDLVALFSRTQGHALAYQAPMAFLDRLPAALGWSTRLPCLACLSEWVHQPGL